MMSRLTEGGQVGTLPRTQDEGAGGFPPVGCLPN